MGSQPRESTLAPAGTFACQIQTLPSQFSNLTVILDNQEQITQQD